MYLKSLTLKGFKSFARPATFAFEPGVTCVVGPNGSGKSNVVDALAWVMGEQGAKSLRGGSMQDVIFQGTPTRPALGRAQVVLTIDNTDGALPIDYSEVTISRTVFRGGASEYAINGTECRLLDVQELLSDSGLGRHMHVIVGQGKLDSVLGASARERRALLEEAAGILKHRRRKESTLRKLEAMQANLDRLADLLVELRRQLKPLGRQAHLAEEARSIQATARDATARLLADDVMTLRRQIDADSEAETGKRSESAVIRESLESVRSGLRRLEADNDGALLDAARSTLFSLRQCRDRLRGLDTLTHQRLVLLGERDEPPTVTPDATAEAMHAARQDTAEAEEKLTEALSAREETRAVVEEKRLAMDAAADALAVSRARRREQERRRDSLAGAAKVAASRLAALREDLARQARRADEAFSRRAAADDERRACGEPDEEGGEALDAARREAERDVERCASAVEDARDEVHALERRRDALAAAVETLSGAVRGEDGSAALASSGLAGIRGLLADHLRVTPGFETAIAAALGDLENAVLAEDRESAVAALDETRSSAGGHVTIVLAGTPKSAPPATHTLPPGLVWAGDVIDGPEVMRALLSGVAVAPDLTTAGSVASFAGALRAVVTRDGDVLRPHSVSGGGERTSGRIEMIARREAMTTELRQVEAQLAEATRHLNGAREAARHAGEVANTAASAARARAASDAEARKRRERAQARYDAASAEAERLQIALREAENAVGTAQTAATSAAEAAAADQDPLPVLDTAAHERAVTEFETAREHDLTARLAVEAARQHREACQAAEENLRRRHESERAARREAEERAARRIRRRARAERVARCLPAVLDAAARAVGRAEDDLAHARARREEHDTEITGARERERSLLSRLHETGEELHRLELRLHERRLRLTGLAERATETVGLGLAELCAQYAPAPDDGNGSLPDGGHGDDDDDGAGRVEPFDRQREEARLADAQRALARIGTVNPLALEEFRALEQRHSFLTEQVNDLTATRKDLLAIIEDVDRKMQDVFTGAFEDTRRAFTQVLPLLFPGGSGTLSLSEPGDMLETGIDIVVRPAGKRVDRLSLLSGGERSLAAIALLVAIFKARPSPFYIMDEIEAALDDANLGRLLDVFDDLRGSSQLIIVTHQKRTMEAADALYGVAMQHDGVSTVVGQRLRSLAATAGTAAGEVITL